ncbi:MAG TPA: antirestriction protein [Cellvibrionaceae bacterium]|nr:antirestriction protein [Cellvibrionaceae bacterium]
MVTNNPNQSIEKQLVPVSMRATALMRHFPSSWFNVENQVFTVMSQIAPDYCGGDWDFIELSNGAFFMAPTRPYKIVVPFGCYFECELGAEACGLLAMMFAYGRLLEQTGDDAFLHHWSALGDFIAHHPDKLLLNRALD